MNIEQTLEQMAGMRYPKQVDVTDQVMRRIAEQPVASSQTRPLWPRISAVAAAAVVILFVVNLTTVYFHSYDEEGIGNMISQYNDYTAWNAVEQVAANPYESLYEDLPEDSQSITR